MALYHSRTRASDGNTNTLSPMIYWFCQVILYSYSFILGRIQQYEIPVKMLYVDASVYQSGEINVGAKSVISYI